MKFANPEFLILLLTIPFLFLYLFWIRPFNLPGLRFSSTKALSTLSGVSQKPLGVSVLGVLRLMALTALILALARPQKGLQSEELTTKATDIMICLDASRSMLSIDFKPENRFQVAKNVIQEFIKGREYDRIGLVLFAEHAITQCPLTLDKSALLNILESLEVGSIPADQTAIGVGLVTSVNRLKTSKAKSKVIILVTDGSNNAGVVDPVTAAKTAAALGIKIYSIGAGSPDGGQIPIDDPVFGRRIVQTQNDLDEDTLLKISGESDGKYFRAKTPGSLKTIFDEINSLEKTDIKIKEYVDYEEYYVGVLLFAIALLFLELTFNKLIFRTIP